MRAVKTLEEYEQFRGQIPDEAFEALCWLAQGETLEEVYRALMMPPEVDEEAEPEVDTADFEAALERPGTKRHFWVVEDEMELENMLEPPLERWRVFLHPVQRKLGDVKGLEFDRVIVAGANDGTIPLKWALTSDDETVRAAGEKAERALLYVSLTRARKAAVLTAHGVLTPYVPRP